MQEFLKLWSVIVIFATPAVWTVQMLLAVPFYRIASQKTANPVQKTALMLIPYLGFIILLDVLARKDMMPDHPPSTTQL